MHTNNISGPWNNSSCDCDGQKYHQKEAGCPQMVRSSDNAIFDLLEMAKKPNANIELLLQDAFKRGLATGKELAKRKAIEAIEQEK